MPETAEIIVFSLISLASLVAWRYLERGLNWLEAHAGKTIPRLGLVILQPVARDPYLLLILLGPLALALAIWSAVKGYWITVGAAFGGFTGGFLLARAQRYGWIPKGVEHIVLGLAVLFLAGLLPGLMAFEVSPWFAFAAIGIAPWGIAELWNGVQMLRAKAVA